MPAPKTALHELSLRLRNASPEVWDAFVREFETYTGEASLAMTDSPADQLLKMQGRAQQCRALLRVFKECDAEFRKPAP